MPELFHVSMLTLAEGGAHESGAFVKDLLVILSAAAFVSIFLKRLRLTSIPGYLLIGALIGALGLVTQPGAGETDSVKEISELAIVLLMFTIGMHLDIDSIRAGMMNMLIVGIGSTIAVMLVAWGGAMLFGLSAPAALTVAMGLSMSSTAVVLGLLQQKRELHATHGRLCVGVSLVQDLISVAVLALMPPIAVWATGRSGGEVNVAIQDAGNIPRWAQLISQGLMALGGIGVMLAFGRFVLPRFLREAGRGGNTEAMLVVSAAAALASAVITAVLGFGPALGAFLAGFLLSATPFRHQLAGQLSPMRDLFMAIFFTAVGAKVDIGVVVSNWWIIALGVIALMSLKAGMIGLFAWIGGATAPIAGLTALYLCQAGEFSLVVFSAAHDQNILTEQSQSLAIAVVVVSLILAVPLVDAGRDRVGGLSRIKPARWFADSVLRQQSIAHVASIVRHAKHKPQSLPRAPVPVPAPILSPLTSKPVMHVIIAGFGIVGRNLAEHFAVQNIDYTIVEMNPATVDKQHKLGKRAVFGDVSNLDVLESAGIHEADAVVLTIPDDDATLRACRAIRAARADIFIAARTSYLSRAIVATELGADHVTVEEVVTATDMASKVVSQLARRASKPATPHL